MNTSTLARLIEELCPYQFTGFLISPHDKYPSLKVICNNTRITIDWSKECGFIVKCGDQVYLDWFDEFTVARQVVQLIGCIK